MKKRILIVEDDPGIKEVLTEMLMLAGYETNVISDGMLILEGKFEQPDLVLVDKQLNGVDGLDVCSYLKTRSETVSLPVIVMSASPDAAELARHAGANDFLEKPFERKKLISTIEQHL